MKELPNIILSKPGDDPRWRALQQNFDHLIGEARGFEEEVSDLVDSLVTDEIPDEIEDGIPDAPANVVLTFIRNSQNRHNRYHAKVKCDEYEFDDDTPVKRYKFRLHRVNSDGTPVLDDAGDPVIIGKNVEAHDDDAGTRVSCRFTRVKQGKYYAADVRAITGRTSEKSDWSTITAPASPLSTITPGKVTGKEVKKKTRAVVVKYNAPTTWSDGTTPIELEEIDHFRIILLTGDGEGSLTEIDRDEYHKGLRKTFHFTKAEMNDLPGERRIHAHVYAIGAEGDDDGADGITSFATPDEINISELDGTITAAQMGTLGFSRYGTTTQMNAASAKTGDIWFNTDTSPARIYIFAATSWVIHTLDTTLLVGTLIANQVAAGAIDGHTISGVSINASTFTGTVYRTAASGNRLEINPGFTGTRLGWYTSTGADAGHIEARENTPPGLYITGGTALDGLDMTGTFQHRGGFFGFCNVIATARETIVNLNTGDTTAQVLSKVNNLLGALRDKGIIS